MLAKIWLRLAAVAIAVVFVVCVVVAWRAEIREQAQLQEQLKSSQQALAAANAREDARDSSVKQLVAQMQKKQAAVQKPEEVVAALPGVLDLPEPIMDDNPAVGTVKGEDGKIVSPAPHVNMPVADLKPLYDSAVACKECQAELAAAQADLKDEKTKTGALGRERDDALKAAKGGSVLRRVARAAKWFLIGAAAGAVAAKVAR
ncbi:MAG: hypothetical protein WBL50_10790 [Candidatus Acidiferrum sp.]